MRHTWSDIAVVLVGAMVWISGSLAPAQTTRSTTRETTATAQTATAPAAAPAQTEQPAAATTTAKKFRGRLPAYFSSVVSEKQRRQIYEVQKEYFERIEALKAQLATLIQEQDEKIDAVLSEEQRQQVETLRANAKAKRGGQAAEEEK